MAFAQELYLDRSNVMARGVRGRGDDFGHCAGLTQPPGKARSGIGSVTHKNSIYDGDPYALQLPRNCCDSSVLLSLTAWCDDDTGLIDDTNGSA